MTRSLIAILIFCTLAYSCQAPKSEEARLVKSLERLCSITIPMDEKYSLANENILLDEGAVNLKTIQLLRGFSVSIKTENGVSCLEKPTGKTKFPFAIDQHYLLENEDLKVRQVIFVSKDKPGITILNFIKNKGKSPKQLSFQFEATSDLKPGAMMDSTFGKYATDRVIFDELTGIFTTKDEENDWFVVMGSSTALVLNPVSPECAILPEEFGAGAAFEIKLELSPDEEELVPVYIAGSAQSEFSAMETLADLRTDLFADWDERFTLTDSLQSTSKIQIPDQNITDAYNWSKYKAGIFKYKAGGQNPTSLEDPSELHSILQELSTVFSQQVDKDIFMFDEAQPRHIQPSWQLFQPAILSLLGIYGDIENRVTYIRPNLPQDWQEAGIENLWIDGNKLNITITTEKNLITVEITQTEKNGGLSIEIPEEFSKVKVLGKEVSTDTKDGYRRILMTGKHVKIEARK
ncbi:hypothetical protein LZF95_11930 [Algoriphagus sp. AGSA1]|uniref:hypothetical protein n=1 Tax=Algoriphagus sp. AGSA1 TaxID=2907213 RepID=UPI001F4710F9|nr:hypothetical protein [Algoriphagus sp. AGSA1]MCE7055386.1 hypothetical protein [Algoriphagus sp. AGSA1]